MNVTVKWTYKKTVAATATKLGNLCSQYWSLNKCKRKRIIILIFYFLGVDALLKYTEGCLEGFTPTMASDSWFKTALSWAVSDWHFVFPHFTCFEPIFTCILWIMIAKDKCSFCKSAEHCSSVDPPPKFQHIF